MTVWRNQTEATAAPIVCMQSFGARVFAFLLACAVALCVLGAGVQPAYAADSGSGSTGSTMTEEEFLQAIDEFVQQAQEADGAPADTASSLDDKAAGQEAISDNDTPLASYSDNQVTADQAASADEENVEEVIEDDENPLAASPYASPVYDFVWVLLGIIVVVAGFFFVSTRRLNKNIQQMRHFVD